MSIAIESPKVINYKEFQAENKYNNVKEKSNSRIESQVFRTKEIFKIRSVLRFLA
jgi:hypothetical protein